MAIGCLVKNQVVTKESREKGDRTSEEILERTEAKIS